MTDSERTSQYYGREPDQTAGLISRMADGDRRALAELYDLTSPVVFGALLKILSNRSDAEDALQDVYIRAWRAAPRFDASRPGRAWLLTVARNRAVDLLRQRRGHADAEDDMDLIADDRRGVEHRLAVSDALAHCLSRLPEDRARLVMAVYMHGLSYQEAADAMGAPINTVRTWLRRSILSLRECLRADDA